MASRIAGAPAAVAHPIPAPAARRVGRPSTPRVWWGQVRHADQAFWRSPVAAFFTLAFPVTLLVLICGIVGNVVVHPETGLRLAQSLTPTFAVFGLVMAAYSSLAIALTAARELGLLRRVRGSPLPPAVYLAGRIGSAVWTALVAFALVTVVGVAAYHVTVVWRTLPALLATLVLGIGTFAALGVVMASLAPNAAAAQGLVNATILPLAFVSGMFSGGTLPRWLATVGDLFPLKHLNAAVTACFDPTRSGSGWYPRDLAVVVGWGVVAAALAVRLFRWQPRSAAAARHAPPVEGTLTVATVATVATEPPTAGPAGRVAATTAGPVRVPRVTAAPGGRPSTAVLLWNQARHDTTASRRNPMAVIFGIAFPLMMIVIFSLSFRHQRWQGVDTAQYLVPVMAVYGIATGAYLGLAQDVAAQREQLVLKRLRGSALPPWVYLAGQVLARLYLAGVIAVACVALGAVAFGVRLPWRGLPAAVLALAAGTACFAALGLMLVAVLPTSTAVTAVGLGTLIPLSFVSDIFMVGTPMPRAMQIVGDVFPLKHVADAAFAATNPAAGAWPVRWGDLAVVAAWTAVGSIVAWRRLRFEPSRGRVRLRPAHDRPAARPGG